MNMPLYQLITLAALAVTVVAFFMVPYHLFSNILFLVGISWIAVMVLAKLKRSNVRVRNLAKMKGGDRSSGSHGSADFARAGDIRKAGLFNDKGFILGCFESRFMRFNQPGHLITFAPTRSGKGIGHVIPNCLDHPGSLVVNDIKGENFAISGDYRKQFGPVFTFSPFADGYKSNSINPLDFIRLGTDFEKDDAALIGEMIIIAEGKDPFWEREARNLVTGLILHVATSRQPALRNMSEVRFLLMQSKRDFDQTLAEMNRSRNQSVRNIGGAFSATEPKVLASIMSVAKSQTAVWESPKLKAVTMKTDLDISRLKKEIATLYIIIPPEYLSVYKPVVRLMIGITLASLNRVPTKPPIPVLFLIDEFPSLGYMENIEEGIGYLAGYGISLWVFIQDMSQLKANYEKWESFIANCAVRVAFGTNDVETAKTLSDMLGTTTITTRGTGKSKDNNQLLGGNKSTNVSETSRQLMTPDEVMRLPNDKMLVFVQGCKPIEADKIFYFKDSYFRGKFGKWSSS